MANIIRDSFVFSKQYQKVIFQIGRDVLDSELNELQDIARVGSYYMNRTFGDVQVPSTTVWGAHYQSSGVARTKHPSAVTVVQGGDTNTVIVGAGEVEVGGYIVQIPAPVTVPLTADSNSIYLLLSENEVTAAQDPTLAVQALGETTRRTKLIATLVAGGVEDWYDLHTATGGVYYVNTRPWEHVSCKYLVAHVYRASGVYGTTGNVTQANIVNRMYLPPQSEAAQDRNVFMWLSDTGSIYYGPAPGIYSGNHLSITGLYFRMPGCTTLYNVTGHWALTAGQCLALQSGRSSQETATDSRTGFRLRRSGDVLITPIVTTVAVGLQTSTPTATETATNIEACVVDLTTAVLDSHLFVLAYMDAATSTVVFRNGVRLRVGQICRSFDEPVYVDARPPTSVRDPLKVYTGPDLNPVSVVDSFGFSGSQVSEYRQPWRALQTLALVTQDPSWAHVGSVGRLTTGSGYPITAFPAFQYGRVVQLPLDSDTTGPQAAVMQILGLFVWQPNAANQFLAEIEWNMSFNENVSNSTPCSVNFYVGIFEIADSATASYSLPASGGGTVRPGYAIGSRLISDTGLFCMGAHAMSGSVWQQAVRNADYGSGSGPGEYIFAADSCIRCRIVIGDRVIVSGDTLIPGALFYVNNALVYSLSDPALLTVGSAPFHIGIGAEPSSMGDGPGVLSVGEIVCRWRSAIAPLAY